MKKQETQSEQVKRLQKQVQRLNRYRETDAIQFAKTVIALDEQLNKCRKTNDLWKKATGYDDPEDLDFFLGRSGLDSHITIMNKLYEHAQIKLKEARDLVRKLSVDGRSYDDLIVARQALRLWDADGNSPAQNPSGAR